MIYVEPLKLVRTTLPLVLIPILTNKGLNVTNSDIKNGNEISTYYQAYDSHGELTVELIMVITR